MKEPVLIQHDDDVEVYNRPAASEYYRTRAPPSIDDEMWIIMVVIGIYCNKKFNYNLLLIILSMYKNLKLAKNTFTRVRASREKKGKISYGSEASRVALVGSLFSIGSLGSTEVRKCQLLQSFQSAFGQLGRDTSLTRQSWSWAWGRRGRRWRLDFAASNQPAWTSLMKWTHTERAEHELAADPWTRGLVFAWNHSRWACAAGARLQFFVGAEPLSLLRLSMSTLNN